MLIYSLFFSTVLALIAIPIHRVHQTPHIDSRNLVAADDSALSLYSSAKFNIENFQNVRIN